MHEQVTIWSDGTRLAGDLFIPDRPAGRQVPAIVLCHGWGGLKAQLNQLYTGPFQAAGFACLTFDYRGWGESDGRLVHLGAEPLTRPGPADLRVRVIREVVDPLDQLRDVCAALDYLGGEDAVDQKRIGIWGSSYGAGLAVATAAADERPRALVGQVGGFGSPRTPQWWTLAGGRATQKARGELEVAIPQGIDMAPPGGLKGTPDLARMLRYQPRDLAAQVRIPSLIIDAQDEELVDRSEHGQAVAQAIGANAPARYETLPGTHYQIYQDQAPAATALAIEWFTAHL
jgi:uncharacterized protein